MDRDENSDEEEIVDAEVEEEEDYNTKMIRLAQEKARRNEEKRQQIK